jgi:hypothetical protein
MTMAQNTSKWGRDTAQKRYAAGGTVDRDEPKQAEQAREAAAKRVRNTRAMPDAFPVGGEPKE